MFQYRKRSLTIWNFGRIDLISIKDFMLEFQYRKRSLTIWNCDWNWVGHRPLWEAVSIPQAVINYLEPLPFSAQSQLDFADPNRTLPHFQPFLTTNSATKTRSQPLWNPVLTRVSTQSDAEGGFEPFWSASLFDGYKTVWPDTTSIYDWFGMVCRQYCRLLDSSTIWSYRQV